MLGQYDEAREDFATAIAKDPQSTMRYTYLKEICERALSSSQAPVPQVASVRPQGAVIMDNNRGIGL